MSIKFHCSKCNHAIKAPDNAAGKVIRCPECEQKMRVPAAVGKPESPAKSKSKVSAGRKRKEAQDSDAFLNNLDLDRLVDAEVQLCQKCASEIPEGETACPSCGFDPQQLTAAGRKRQKMSAQGIDPATFYETVFKDPFRFAFSHIGHLFKSGMILSTFFLLAGLCVYYLIWVATTPPFGFWSILTLVSVMIPIGWLQVQHLEVIKLTLQKKDEFKKIPFDFALCGMYGLKFVGWVLIYGLPFWIVFGGLGALLNSMEVSYGMGIGLSLGLCALVLFTPQAMSHLAMPVEQPGWFFPSVAKTLGVSFLPGLVWAVLFVLINLPVIGSVVGVYYMGGAQLEEFFHARYVEGQVHTGKVLIDLAEGASSEALKEAYLAEGNDLVDREVPVKNWNAIWLPLGGGVLCSFLLAFSSLVVARANGLFTLNLKKGLDLITSTKEVVWERKEKGDEKVRTKRTTMPAPPGKRFLAFLGDSLILAIVTALIDFIVYQILVIIFESAGIDLASATAAIAIRSSLSGVNLLILAFYFISLESGTDQATPIKKATNLYVCNEELRPISTGQAVVRFLAFLFVSNLLTLGIGSLICFFREDRKTLHDLLSGTQVRADKPQPKGA